MTSKLKMRNIIFILIGSAIFSFGIVNINIENHLAEGGFTGITLLLYFLFKFDPSYSNLIFKYPYIFYWLEVTWQNDIFIYINWNL